MRIKQFIDRYNLKRQIIAIAIVISVIPLSILGISAYKINSNGLMDQKISDTQTNLRSINQSITSSVNMRKIPALRFCNSSEARQLVSNVDFEETQYQDCLYSLQRFFNEYMNTKGIHSIVLCGSNDSFYASRQTYLSSAQYLESFYTAAETCPTKPWWDNLENDGGTYYLPYNIPILDASKENLIGLLTINFMESELRNSYQYYLTGGSQIMLTSGTGEIISSEDLTILTKQLEDVYKLEQTLYEEGVNSFLATINGKQCLVSASYNVTYDIYVFCISNLESMHVAQRHLLGTLLLLILCSLAIVVFLAIFLSHSITKPVNTLVQTIESLEIGTTVLPPPQDTHNEWGVIGNALSQMTVKLRDYSEQLVAEQKAKREAVLQALLMQINPHFLGNTLASAIWLIQMDKKSEAITLITALSQMFKLSLYKGQEEIPISDELKYIENYLRVHKIRYGNEFDYSIHCPDELSHHTIIKLLTQPIVENAIYHGINTSDGSYGHIDIFVRQQSTSILICVENTPTELTNEDILRINNYLAGTAQNKDFGIGLRNVAERIRLVYGPAYGLTFALRDNRTVVTIEIPILSEKGGDESQ